MPGDQVFLRRSGGGDGRGKTCHYGEQADGHDHDQVDHAAVIVAEVVLRGSVGHKNNVKERFAGQGLAEINGIDASAEAIRRIGGESRLHGKTYI